MSEDNSKLPTLGLKWTHERHYGDLLSAVSACLADVLGIDASIIKPQSGLLELGAQSVDFVDIAFRLEQQFSVALPRSYLLPDDYTVDDLGRAIEHELMLASEKLTR